jgi:hypothetical protein
MYPRRWSNDRLHDIDPIDRAATIVGFVRWLFTVLLTSWEYFE